MSWSIKMIPKGGYLSLKKTSSDSFQDIPSPGFIDIMTPQRKEAALLK